MDANLVRRIGFAVIAIPLALGIVWYGGFPLAFLLAVASALGTKELFGLAARAGCPGWLLGLAVRAGCSGSLFGLAVRLRCSSVLACAPSALAVTLVVAPRPPCHPWFLIGSAQSMERSTFFDNLQAHIGKMLDEAPAADLRNNLRAMLQQGFERFDLATREQLDLQTELLARAQTRITDLEARIARLEGERAVATSPIVDSPLG